MTTRPASGVVLDDAVPVADRLQVAQLVRLAGAGLVLICAALVPSTLDGGRTPAALGALGVAAAVLGVQAALRWWPALGRGRDGGRLLLVTLFALDAGWLAGTIAVTGGLASPVRYLVLLHVGAVVLLSSARTGLAVALWHTVLLGVVLAVGQGIDAQAASFVVALWMVALSTWSLSAVKERELQRRRHDLEALTTFAERVELASDSKSVAGLLLDSVVRTFAFPRAAVLAGPEGQLALLASYGLDPGVADRPGRPGHSAVVRAAHEARTPQLVRGLDPAADPWLDHLLPAGENLVVVPLVAEGRPLGALVLEQPARLGGRISRRVVTALERSASYAALALRNAWLLEQVQRLAATDGLTKIANRRTFEATLEREVARATRGAEQVSLVMVDIDHFKALNDTHGHQAGDEVLRNVAAALAIECRDFDTPARYGGEEFAIVLPGCGPEESVAIAERLRRAVSSAPSVVPITASAGVASYPAHAGDADTLVRAADDALYQSKHAGRDCTTASAGVPPEAQVDALLRRAVSQRLGRRSGRDGDGGRPGAAGPAAHDDGGVDRSPGAASAGTRPRLVPSLPAPAPPVAAPGPLLPPLVPPPLAPRPVGSPSLPPAAHGAAQRGGGASGS